MPFKINLVPARYGYFLKTMKLNNFSVMQVNKKWWVMPDWNNPAIIKLPYIFDPQYNTSLVKEFH